MKTKKKLLIAMAAMSVAAIGAGTVSTFAWYTATAAGTAATNDAGTGVAVATNPSYTVENLELPLDVTVKRWSLTADAEKTTDLNIELGTWLTSADSAKTGYVDPGFYHGYLDTAGNVYYSKVGSSGAKDNVSIDNFAVYKITIAPAAAGYSSDGISYDTAAIANALKGSSVNVKLEGTARNSTINSRAMFFVAKSSNNDAPGTKPTSVTEQGEATRYITGVQLGDSNGWTNTVIYVGLYIEGDTALDSSSHMEADSGDNVHGDFKVTVGTATNVHA